MEYTINNAYIIKALKMGEENNTKQLFLLKHTDGKYEMKGNLNKIEAMKFLEQEINVEESLLKKWIPLEERFKLITLVEGNLFLAKILLGKYLK